MQIQCMQSIFKTCSQSELFFLIQVTEARTCLGFCRYCSYNTAGTTKLWGQEIFQGQKRFLEPLNIILKPNVSSYNECCSFPLPARSTLCVALLANLRPWNLTEPHWPTVLRLDAFLWFLYGNCIDALLILTPTTALYFLKAKITSLLSCMCMWWIMSSLAKHQSRV